MMSPSLPFAPLASGVVVAGRFTLQRLAGRGGMGVVYQAQDSVSGRPVALKLLHALADQEVSQRFTREAEVLSQLRHPGIVSYVAHGLAHEGQPFLAMEWLEGEDLARRLARKPLALSETMLLIRRVADVLSAAHAQDIVHRDIKPSNLYLRAGRVEDVVLLDFGLARIAANSLPPLTASMAVLGTPGYMAPEQASSQEHIAPAADVFSLGCVLYECLAGQAPFRAPHLAAVLAKILFAEPPALRTLRPELPASLQSLLDRMLAKTPEQRLANGHHLMRALDGLEAFPELPPPGLGTPQAPVAITDTEQHLVSVLLATSGTITGEGPTLGMAELGQMRAKLEPLLQELQARGAKASLLADGSLLATLMLERGAATDQAELAAVCALSIKERWPDGMVVLTTGLSLRGKPVPVGEVMDRAGELIRRMEGQPAATAQVLLDETTAGLLGPRFELDKARTGTFLLGAEQLRVDESRPLLGRPTPCVGREQELSLLEMAFVASVEDSSARALLVTAPAGTGKSRLRHEFLRRLERRPQPPLVLLGRADPMSANSAYGLLGHAVRQLCGVLDGEPPEARREKLAARISRHLAPDQAQDTVEFLGELCGVPFPRELSPRLRAAHEDPQGMSLQVTRAMVTLLQAELTQGPVLLVLEDLHWSDVPSVRLVEEALRELTESPLLVLALARPEAREMFPRLWGQHLQEVQLRGLSQKASSRLIQEVLPQVSPAVVSRLVEQAAGNALFLEELIRGVAEGRGDETPGTVLAMLQSRLQRLEPGARRVLLASSIFGRSFWAGGVKALLEEELSAEELDSQLRHLTELELVELRQASRFPSERQYHFRHALVRDAAYSLVANNLKSAGHRLAGAWLEKVGEQDPLVLAEHYQLGQDKEKAVHFFTRAGEQLFERHDLPGAQRCLEAALACEPQGDALIVLRALDVGISCWRHDFARSYAVGLEVLPSLRLGSAAWVRVMSGLLLIGAQSGQHEDVARLSPVFLSAWPDLDAMPIYIEAACILSVTTCTWRGLRQQASEVLGRMNEVTRPVAQLDGISRGYLGCASGYFHHFLDARPWLARTQAQAGTQAFLEVNSERNQAAPRSLLGLALVALGDVPTAIAEIRLGLEGALRTRQDYPIAYTQIHLALVLVHSTDPAHHTEARQLALEILKTDQMNVVHAGMAHITLAKVALRQGQLAEAETRARQACEGLGLFRPYELIARTTLCTVLLAQQRAPEARAEAEQGVRELEQLGPPGATAVGMRLALAEACFAQGEQASGDEALHQALECVNLRASDIPEAAARERFLSQVPENARVRELARQRWGSDAP